jgi:predicted HicB family RNase H-like nuclease
MRDVLVHKGFIGSVHFDADGRTLFGKVEGVADLVTFEGKDVDELTQAFQDAVEDYLTLCKEAGKEPMKSFKGSFNVRIPPGLHVKAALRAAERKISLNQFVKEAIEVHV